MKTTHDLLVLLLKQLNQDKRDMTFEYGLCWEARLLWQSLQINMKELFILEHYIKQNMPQNYYLENDHRYLNSNIEVCADGNNWGWFPGSYKPRLVWLREQIKKNK